MCGSIRRAWCSQICTSGRWCTVWHTPTHPSEQLATKQLPTSLTPLSSVFLDGPLGDLSGCSTGRKIPNYQKRAHHSGPSNPIGSLGKWQSCSLVLSWMTVLLVVCAWAISDMVNQCGDGKKQSDRVQGQPTAFPIMYPKVKKLQLQGPPHVAGGGFWAVKWPDKCLWRHQTPLLLENVSTFLLSTLLSNILSLRWSSWQTIDYNSTYTKNKIQKLSLPLFCWVRMPPVWSLASE